MKREFVINRHGKDYVLYAGLLDEAHQQGLSAIRTQLLQPPAPENGQVAICLAEVTTERGTFTGLGDASPDNVSRAMVNALIRLAETRAKARALRDAVNVGMLSFEELAEGAADTLALDGADTAPPPRALPRLTSTDGPRTAHGAHGAGSSHGTGTGTGMAATHSAGNPHGTNGANGANGTHTVTSVIGGAGAAGPAGMAGPTGGVPASVPTGHTLPPGVVPLPTRPAPPAAARPAPPVSSGPAAGSTSRVDVEGPLEPARPRRIRESVAAASGAGKAPADGAPATPTQLETIAKLARSVGRIVPTQDLTRAAASELITRLSEERYGARRGG
jgi:hypothetical protein